MDFFDTIRTFVAVFVKIIFSVPSIKQKRTVFLSSENVISVFGSVIVEFSILYQMTIFIEIVFFTINFANFVLIVDTVFVLVTYITIIIGVPTGGGVIEALCVEAEEVSSEVVFTESVSVSVLSETAASVAEASETDSTAGAS